MSLKILGAPASLPAFFPKMIITAGKDGGVRVPDMGAI